MTDATVLADALVEAGIGVYGPANDGYRYYQFDALEWMSAENYITDWRVAGKVLESMPSFEMWEVGDGHQVVFDKRFVSIQESLPAAIIEAWYEARQ